MNPWMTMPHWIKPTVVHHRMLELDIVMLIRYVTYHAGHRDATENLVLEHCTPTGGSGSSEIPTEQDQSTLETV